MSKTPDTRPLYVLEDKDFGPRFSFHAADGEDAKGKALRWLGYHSMLRVRHDFTVRPAVMTDPPHIHNDPKDEWVTP